MQTNVTFNGNLTYDQYLELVKSLGPFYWPSVIISIILTVIAIVGMWKMFEKAGRAGWMCLIPFYGTYKLVEIGAGNGWMFLLMLIPIVNIVFVIWFNIQLAKAYGQPGVFAVGLIFLSTIFYAILGFGSSEYVGPRGLTLKEE